MTGKYRKRMMSVGRSVELVLGRRLRDKERTGGKAREETGKQKQQIPKGKS